MSASFTSSVYRVAYEYEARIGLKPTKLLLGKRELGWLKRIAASAARTIVTESGPSRTEYMGLAVYEMDDDEFLGVA